MNNADYAWCAGFFEADGWSSVQRGKLRKDGTISEYLKVSVGQRHPEVLERFVRLIGVPVKLGGPWQAKTENTVRYRIQYVGTLAQEVMKRMWPYMGEVKRAQALRSGYVDR